MIEKEIEIFVPGRLCLFGEHSDWAGGHGRQNSKIEKGYAIIAPTNQGNYAKVRKLNEPILKFISQPFGKTLDVKLREDELLNLAEKGDVFSYIAGVAHEVVGSYHNHKRKGLKIENYRSNLPIKKGLSSSASICVLTAKAFNEAFRLNWTQRRIMEVAYLGEITTPSRCGKLDQACAYNSPIMMEFDGDKITTKELKIGGDIFLLVVDLKSQKDTVKILSDLSKGFPFPATELERQKHHYFNNKNKEIVSLAKIALESGDADRLGTAMNYAQKCFDEYLAPSCPEELTAPVLHSVLGLSEIREFIYGGKGVGSGGDGTAQLVCKSEEDRRNAKEILEEKGYCCFDLNLNRTE